ncbi:MAG: ABC transporter ATP-binding protein, partial [Anaerovoracaceae bacterium]
MQNAVVMKDINKSFGALKANENANLSVKSGEVHAILGENGAGKSTLMNMLSGIYSPDSGSIFIYGEEVNFASPKDAINLGVGMIHQHFKLADVMTAKDNIAMGAGPTTEEGIIALSEKYGLDISPSKKVYNMSVSEKQTLEIIKVLYRGAKILILDEPTAVLTPQEIRKLFDIIRNMKEEGCAILIITHKLGEVMEISDRITVLRKGKTIATVEKKDTNSTELIEMMVGKKVDLAIDKPKYINQEEEKKPLLKVDGMTVRNKEGKKALKGLNFDLFPGEILGVAGVAGSGQKELCETMAGLLKSQKGRIYFNDENILGKSPVEIINLGIRMGFIPEDRLGMGLVGNMDIVHNMILKDYKMQPGIFLKKKPAVEKAERIV